MDNESSTVQYLKEQEKSRILTSTIIKLILAVIGAVALMKRMPVNFTNIMIGILVFAVVYDLCSVYQFSLRLTRNYIVAFLVSLAIIGGALYLYSMAEEKYDFLNGDYSGTMEYVITFFVILVFLIPLIRNIRSVIVLSRK